MGTAHSFMDWESPGWAVITGASSGIGAEYARQLAGEGFSLFLTARREDRLNDLAANLRASHGVSTEVLAADLSRLEEILRLADRLRSLENVDILINNAGSSTVGPFANSDLDGQLALLAVQAAAPVVLSRAVIPKMVERSRGLLIFTSSLSAFMPAPGSGVYIPAKAFLAAFAKTLAPEMKAAGIRVQALCPGYTHTEFHDGAAYDGLKAFLPKWVWGTSRSVVEASLRGARKGKTQVVPGFLNRLTLRLVPKRLLLRSYMKRRWAEVAGADPGGRTQDR